MNQQEQNEKMRQLIDCPHSVSFSVNAKQLLSGEVKAYGATPEEAMSAAKKLKDEMLAIIKINNMVV